MSTSHFQPIILCSEHSKKFKPEDMLTRINEKNCIVTGANSGLGFAAAEGLASRCLFCFNFYLFLNILSLSC